MNVAVSVPGKFQPAYLWARWLEQRDELRRLITPLPYGRTRQFGVTRSRTRTLAPLGAALYVLQRFAPANAQREIQRAFSALYDSVAARMIGGCDVFNGWSSTSLQGIRAAHARGIPAVLQCGSAHIVAQTDMLAEEHAHFGARAPATHPSVIKRALSEYDEADAIVVPSSFAYRTFVEHGMAPSKLTIVNEVALPVGGFGSPHREPRHGRLCVLFVGRCELRKGVQYLFRASEQLAVPATLRLVGQPDPSLCTRLRAPAGAQIAGPKRGAALAAEYANADILVLPSVEDGFGLVAVEAMAAGLPVITSDQAGCADLIRDGENGFVVPARDAGVLADRIDALLRDGALRSSMGAAARATVCTRGWQAYGAEMYERLYRPLLAAANVTEQAHARAG